MGRFTGKTVFLFGNPDLPFDAVPVELFSPLVRKFPDMNFRVVDPNELDLPKDGDDDLIIIDTVEGLTKPRFISIDEIAQLKARVTAHDFDLGSYLLLAQKMNKNIGIHIIGIPMSYEKGRAFEEIKPLLSSLA
jgi:Ni,Fe-hydrogenase maturation factor